MKKVVIVLLSTVICLFVCLFVIFSNTTNLRAIASEEDVFSYNIEDISYELFGKVSIKSSEYLYSLDDSADFIYVDFDNGGYAVYIKSTMEVVEYSVQGSLPYSSAKTRKYYVGPTNYLTKESENFVDVVTKKVIIISDANAKSYSQTVRNNFLSKSKVKVNLDELVDISSKVKGTEVPSNAAPIKEAPPIDSNPLIPANPPGAIGTTYIPNAQYFLQNPRHGVNTTGTCGAVAAQLLLSYNNYYADRRIILPEYLNGGWIAGGNGDIFDSTNYTNPSYNPNVCVDPMSMTRETLGSNGINETDAGTFFNYVVSNIPANATVASEKTGIINMLNSRNIDYSIDSKNTYGFYSVNSTDIQNEINAGRPLIIGMHSMLGGSNHFVVGYGYHSYTYYGTNETYLGYVTHFGHSNEVPYRLSIWINSSWCDSYISLNINHTHNYVSTGNIINGNSMELICEDCGHRTVDSLSNHFESGNIVYGDFNGDTLEDIAVFLKVRDSVNIDVWFGSSDGGFTYSQAFWSQSQSNFNLDAIKGRIVAGDFNGDGKTDIAAMYYYGSGFSRILLWYGGESSFSYYGAAWESSGFNATAVSDKIVAGDFNGNGKSDIAALYDYGNGTAKMFLWYGYSVGLGYYGVATSHTNLNASAVSGRMVVGDFNNDQKCDIAALYNNGNGTASMLLWYGYSTAFGYYGIASYHSNFNANAVTGKMVAGDFDGNGYCDIAALYHNGNGTGNMLLWKGYSVALGYYGISVPISATVDYFSDATGRMLVGDFDKDGLVDIGAFSDMAISVKIRFWRGIDTVASLSYNSADYSPILQT